MGPDVYLEAGRGLSRARVFLSRVFRYHAHRAGLLHLRHAKRVTIVCHRYSRGNRRHKKTRVRRRGAGAHDGGNKSATIIGGGLCEYTVINQD